MTDVPITTTEWLSTTQDLVNSVPKKDLTTVIERVRGRLRGGRRRPLAADRLLVVLHRRGQRELRADHHPGQREPDRPGHPARQGLGDPLLHARPAALLRHHGRRRRQPAEGDRRRQRHRQHAACLPGGERSRPRQAVLQPRHDRRDPGQAPGRHPDDPDPLPLRRRRRLRRGLARRERPGRRPLRADPDRGAGGLRAGLQRQGPRPADRARQRPDGRGRPLCRAGGPEQPARCAARPGAGADAGRPAGCRRSGDRQLRP